jgi:hypothetical protein
MSFSYNEVMTYFSLPHGIWPSCHTYLESLKHITTAIDLDFCVRVILERILHDGTNEGFVCHYTRISTPNLEALLTLDEKSQSSGLGRTDEIVFILIKSFVARIMSLPCYFMPFHTRPYHAMPCRAIYQSCKKYSDVEERHVNFSISHPYPHDLKAKYFCLAPYLFPCILMIYIVLFNAELEDSSSMGVLAHVRCFLSINEADNPVIANRKYDT